MVGGHEQPARFPSLERASDSPVVEILAQIDALECRHQPSLFQSLALVHVARDRGQLRLFAVVDVVAPDHGDSQSAFDGDKVIGTGEADKACQDGLSPSFFLEEDIGRNETHR